MKSLFKNVSIRTKNAEAITGESHKMLLELIKHHDNQEKMVDVNYFTVDFHPTFKETRCFFIVRNDGTKEDFSFHKCVNNFIDTFAKGNAAN